MMLLDPLLEARYALRQEGCLSVNWKKNAHESCIIVVIQIAFTLDAHGKFSVYRRELCTLGNTLGLMNFEVL